MDELEYLMQEISEWSDSTFGKHQRNPAILYHLKKEVDELIEAVNNFQNYDAEPGSEYEAKLLDSAIEEYADCMMLLLDSATHFGFGAESLLKSVADKLAKNKTRKWGKPDENGVVEHIKEDK